MSIHKNVDMYSALCDIGTPLEPPEVGNMFIVMLRLQIISR